jgi:hypothetical protein
MQILWRTMKNPSQNFQRPSRESNRPFMDCNSGYLRFESTYFVTGQFLSNIAERELVSCLKIWWIYLEMTPPEEHRVKKICKQLITWSSVLLEKPVIAVVVNTFLALYETGYSLACSQKSATWTYSESDGPSPHSWTLILKLHFILIAPHPTGLQLCLLHLELRTVAHLSRALMLSEWSS